MFDGQRCIRPTSLKQLLPVALRAARRAAMHDRRPRPRVLPDSRIDWLAAAPRNPMPRSVLRTLARQVTGSSGTDISHRSGLVGLSLADLRLDRLGVG